MIRYRAQTGIERTSESSELNSHRHEKKMKMLGSAVAWGNVQLVPCHTGVVCLLQTYYYERGHHPVSNDLSMFVIEPGVHLELLVQLSELPQKTSVSRGGGS